MVMYGEINLQPNTFLDDDLQTFIRAYRIVWNEMEFERENVTPRFVARFASSRRTLNIRDMGVLRDLFDWTFMMYNGARNCDPFMTGNEIVELYEGVT